jgi:hypothetical protein
MAQISVTEPIVFIERSEEMNEDEEARIPIYFHLVNHSNRPLRLPDRMFLGNLERVREIAILSGDREAIDDLEKELDSVPRTEPDMTNITDSEIEELVAKFQCETEEQRKRARALIRKHARVFSLTPKTPKTSKLPPHRIDLREGAKPVTSPVYHSNPEKREVIRKIVREYREAGITRPSTSEYSAPMLVVKKKDGNWRYVVDYRKLNE